MSDENSIPETERATKTAARVLFALCLVVALAIFVLNTSLADRRKLLEKNDERYQAHTQMVERLNSFRAKDAELFENLVTSSFHIAPGFHDSEKRYPGLVRTVRISPRSWGYVPVPEERQQRLNEAARSFGKGARAVFAAGQSVDHRLAALRAAATLAYQGDDEATAFVNVELAPKLAALDAPSEWEQIAWWIAGGDWPNPGGTHSVGGPGGVSFGVRITERPTDREDRFYAYRLLRFTPSPQSADQELFSLWKQSYTDRWSAATGAPRLAIPTLGLSISAEETVAMAAPILLLFQLMFLVHWERRSASPTSSDYSGFSFPS